MTLFTLRRWSRLTSLCAGLATLALIAGTAWVGVATALGAPPVPRTVELLRSASERSTKYAGAFCEVLVRRLVAHGLLDEADVRLRLHELAPERSSHVEADDGRARAPLFHVHPDGWFDENQTLAEVGRPEHLVVRWPDTNVDELEDARKTNVIADRTPLILEGVDSRLDEADGSIAWACFFSTNTDTNIDLQDYPDQLADLTRCRVDDSGGNRLVLTDDDADVRERVLVLGDDDEVSAAWFEALNELSVLDVATLESLEAARRSTAWCEEPFVPEWGAPTSIDADRGLAEKIVPLNQVLRDDWDKMSGRTLAEWEDGGAGWVRLSTSDEERVLFLTWGGVLLVALLYQWGSVKLRNYADRLPLRFSAPWCSPSLLVLVTLGTSGLVLYRGTAPFETWVVVVGTVVTCGFLLLSRLRFDVALNEVR